MTLECVTRAKVTKARRWLKKDVVKNVCGITYDWSHDLHNAMVVLVLVLDRIQPILRGNRVGLRRTSLLYPLRKPSPSPRRVPVPFPRHDRRPDPKHGCDFKKNRNKCCDSILMTSRMEREGEMKNFGNGIDFSRLLVFFFFSMKIFLETFVKFNWLEKKWKDIVFYFIFFFEDDVIGEEIKRINPVITIDVKETGLNRFRAKFDNGSGTSVNRRGKRHRKFKSYVSSFLLSFSATVDYSWNVNRDIKKILSVVKYKDRFFWR